jgi:hypothetical protein
LGTQVSRGKDARRNDQILRGHFQANEDNSKEHLARATQLAFFVFTKEPRRKTSRDSL